MFLDHGSIFEPEMCPLNCHWKLLLFFIGAKQSTYCGDIFDKIRQRSRESKGVVFSTPSLSNLVQPAPWSRCCVLGQDGFWDDYLCLVAANKQQIHCRKIRRSLPGKLLNRCWFLQTQSSYRNETWADHPIISDRRCSVTGKQICKYYAYNKALLQKTCN